MSESRAQIPALVASNLDGLGRLCSLLESRNDPSQPLAQSYLARFKLWAGSLAAHRASGTRSLEYRLRDASSIRKHITSLLKELNGIVVGEALPILESGPDGEGRPQSPGDSVDDELAALFDAGSNDGLDLLDGGNKEVTDFLFGIGNIIDCLLRLSVTISNPAPHDHFKSRAGLELTRHFESWDTKHVQQKFPQINAKLAERLGRMLAYRRRYFKYREDHHNRLKEGLEEALDDEVSLGRGTTVASSLPQALKDGTQTNLTVVNDDRSEISATSYASSDLGGSTQRVPRIPKQYVDGPFLCPYCYVFISVASRHEWKKHVFRDLRPYACLEETCVVDHDFQRRKDWTRHMLQDHWRAWNCPFGCVGEYSSSSALRNHLHKNHAIDVASQDVDASVNLSSKADVSRSQGSCPLCHDFEIKSSHQYQSHVAHHLEQLALFVLPTQDDNDSDDDDGDDDDDDDDDNDDDQFRDNISAPLRKDTRRYSWSCSALATYDRAFVESTTRPGEADTCGYCGEDFARSGLVEYVKHVTEQDWDDRVRHLQDHHKFRECNSSKKFFRADHFNQHLKHSHAGISGEWTNILINACMIEAELPQPPVR